MTPYNLNTIFLLKYNPKIWVIFLGVLIFSIFPSYSQDCNEVKQLSGEINNSTIEKGVDFVIGKLIGFLGTAPSTIYKLGTPAKVGTPKDQYIASLKNLNNHLAKWQESGKGYHDKLRKEVESLLMYEEGFLVESGFKPESDCYIALQNLSNTYIKLMNALKNGNQCQFYRFTGDLKRGTNCNSESSARVRVINTMDSKMVMSASFQKQDGSWTSWETYTVLPGKIGSWWACSTNGNYIVLGVDKSHNDKLKCKKITQQQAFDYAIDFQSESSLRN